jgi:glycerophosphoryl diester phosphodiesterase
MICKSWKQLAFVNFALYFCKKPKNRGPLTRTSHTFAIIVLLLLSLLLLPQCRKAELHRVQNLNGNRIEVVGHGGIGFQSLNIQSPHNSFTSVLKTIEAYQADGVEIDVQLSRDNVLFMYHDRLLESMTDCFECVNNSMSAELLLCRFRNDFYVNVFTEEFLTPLDRAMARFASRTHPPKVFLDLKTFEPCDEEMDYADFRLRMADAVHNIILKHDAIQWVYVESADMELLLDLQSRDENYLLIYDSGDIPAAIYRAADNGLYGIVCHSYNIKKKDVKLAHSLGVKVSLYGVKSRPGHIRAIRKNPDYIQTENLPLLQQILLSSQ